MLLLAPENTRLYISAITIFLMVLLAGCTSTWKAPVDSYSYKTRDPVKSQVRQTPINSTYYRVQKGDTLYSIAWRTGRDYQNLAQWNRLSPPYTIYTGQLLLTRPPAKTAVSSPRKNTATDKKPVKQPAKKTVSNKNTTPTYNQHLRWRWPTNGKIIKAFRKGDDTRKGVVLSGKVGQSIVAAEDGKVVYSGSGLIGYGQLIIIKHNKNYLSAYGHNRKLLVKEGDRITKGKKIAEMGMKDAGIPALHFEIRKNGNPLNPIAVLPKRN